jgi:hypothetical protein
VGAVAARLLIEGDSVTNRSFPARRESHELRYFYAGLFLVSAATLTYEVVLTRLLSAVCWYYLAFVSISMAMFGMTVGALAVQLRADLFPPEKVHRRLTQSSMGMAVSLPLSLLTMLAVPIDFSYAAETLYSFLLFSVIIAVPFFFSGIVVCLSLTRVSLPVGRIYAVDLLGAASGCFGAILLLTSIDAPSGIFLISALTFAAAAAFGTLAGDRKSLRRAWLLAPIMLLVAALNSATLHGIQPIWSKGAIDHRGSLLAEIWTPISKVRAREPQTMAPQMWGKSPKTPPFTVDQIFLDIDNDAETPITRFNGDLSTLGFLRYDVTSIGAELRRGGDAAVIGVGGGRDVLNCAANHFRRIVGIEVNSAIVDLTSRRLLWFSGFNRIPGFELHRDEGRSYLTRSPEKFDLIQASMVDTWAATTAGAMSLTENALYTVEGWKVFYSHLTPGGLIAFSRWYQAPEYSQTYRLFSLAWATLLAEGVTDPGSHLALVNSAGVATLLASNRPLSPVDLSAIRARASGLDFKILFLPGHPPGIPELRAIASARTAGDLDRLRYQGYADLSPVYDSSPYFFNAVHFRDLVPLISRGMESPNLRALLFVLGFMLAALILVILTIVVPLKRWSSRRAGRPHAPAGGLAYFVAIGLGFMLVEIAMMQQLSLLLGQPVYSLVVVLAGLIFSTGFGSLASDRLRFASSLASRLPALGAMAVVAAYSLAVLPVVHRAVADALWLRAAWALLLVMPCGFVMGFCFPVGLRWLAARGQAGNLPWMWALNGGAATLGSFLAVVISMDSSIPGCVLAGAACYLLASVALPSAVPAEVPARVTYPAAVSPGAAGRFSSESQAR